MSFILNPLSSKILLIFVIFSEKMVNFEAFSEAVGNFIKHKPHIFEAW